MQQFESKARRKNSKQHSAKTHKRRTRKLVVWTGQRAAKVKNGIKLL